MTRVHDMGGRYGDAPIGSAQHPAGGDEPVFKTSWHARALALVVAAGALGKWNIDASRHARECLPPQDYARFSYYEKWLAGLANMLVQHKLVSRAELTAGQAHTKSDPEIRARCLSAKNVVPVLRSGGPSARVIDRPQRFSAGDRVRTRAHAGNALIAGGHSRMPDYVRARTGVIVRCHGGHVLPDSNAHFRGEAPEPLYAVAFSAGELWPHPENPADQIILDLWESYLEPA